MFILLILFSGQYKSAPDQSYFSVNIKCIYVKVTDEQKLDKGDR